MYAVCIFGTTILRLSGLHDLANISYAYFLLSCWNECVKKSHFTQLSHTCCSHLQLLLASICFFFVFGFTLHFCPLQAVKCRRNFLPLVYAAFGIVYQTFPVLNEISTGGFLQNKRSLLFYAINFDSFPARSCISARALPPLPLPAHMFACNVWHDQWSAACAAD